MKKYISIILFILTACKQNIIHNPEEYYLTEKNMYDDCNLYQLFFENGDYLFKYSLAGSCNNLTKEDYIIEYTDYLKRNKALLSNRLGFIILDKFDVNDFKKVEDTILFITKEFYKKKIYIYNSDKLSFTLKLE